MILRGLLYALVLYLFALPAVAAEQRVALVIGNGAYGTATPLKNPVNDSRAMEAKLTELGFKVLMRENVTKLQFERAIIEFGEMLSEGGVGLFFYAGHGLQLDGRNYLVPIDASIATGQRVRLEAIDVDVVMDQMAAAQTRVSLVILDACRDNPFERRFRSASGGLAQINAPAGTLIAYATAPGKTAADGTGTNSVYTTQLLTAVDQAGLPVEEVFKRVRVEVARNSSGRQTPWEASSLTGTFYFREPVRAAAPPGGAGSDREALFWQSIKDSRDAADFQAYLQRYPGGEFADLARNRLQSLQRRQAAATIDPIEKPFVATAATRVRDRPDVTARQVASLNPGETVTVLGKVQNEAWYLVEREGKPLGYAPTASLEDAVEAARKATEAEGRRKAEEERKRQEAARLAASEAEGRRKAEDERKRAEEARRLDEARRQEEAKRQEDVRRQEAQRLAMAEGESRRRAEEERRRQEATTRSTASPPQQLAAVPARPAAAPTTPQFARRGGFGPTDCAGHPVRLGAGECTLGKPIRSGATGGEVPGSGHFVVTGRRGKLLLDGLLIHPGVNGSISVYTYERARELILQNARSVAPAATLTGASMIKDGTTAVNLEIGGAKCFGFDVAGPNAAAGYRYVLRGLGCEDGRTTPYSLADVQEAIKLFEVAR